MSGSEAGSVLLADLRAQVERLVGCEADVRKGRAGAVHRMRVAARRLRSDLTAFGALLDDDRAGEARHELRWWGRRLGAARDAQVLHERIVAVADAAASDPPQPDPQSDPATDRSTDGPPEAVLVALDRQASAALRRVRVRLDRRRYAALVRTLHDLADAPRLHADAALPAHEVLPPLVDAAYAEVLALLAEADATTGARERDHLLHEVRKAAKRTRYVTEAAGDAIGDRGTAVAALQGLQRQLGRHRDVGTARVWLRELAVTSDPGTAFWCGRADAVLETQDVRARGARSTAVARVRATSPGGRA